jgi:hypothetical protein
MTTIVKMKAKSNSYSQDKLKILSDYICEDIERLLSILNIEDYRMLDNMVITSCPIHGGDNTSALNLYYTGDSYCGNWKCRSHKCEEYFKSSIIGFIRGCLSKNKYDWQKPGDQMISFQEALDFATQFVNKDIKDIKVSRKQKEKSSFVNTIKYINNEQNNNEKIASRVSRQMIRNNLSIPSQYFISRGFSKDILNKYDVGDCIKPNKEMSNRAVVPVYDNDHKFMTGCSGRTITNETPKWRHSSGFKSENMLYNYWYAKQHIQTTGCVILVESPGNVWKLEEAGIHNSVALFGSNLADKQKMLLDISGAMTIVTIMDRDEAGDKAATQIYNKCHRTYIVKNIKIENYNDIAEMPLSEIETQIKHKLKDIL